jgi:ribonuclease J
LFFRTLDIYITQLKLQGVLFFTMAEKLKIISLGGLNEVGKNLTVYEYGADILVIDCGLGFPDDEMYGVDIVIPDFTYLVKNKDRIRGIVLTHGHEDHIGALPYLMRDINAPIYATPLTAGLVKIKLQEHGLSEKVELNVKKAGESFKLGCFKVELIHTNHSIPDAVSLAVKTPVGMIVHTGDFKIDTTPISGGMIEDRKSVV